MSRIVGFDSKIVAGKLVKVPVYEGHTKSLNSSYARHRPNDFNNAAGRSSLGLYGSSQAFPGSLSSFSRYDDYGKTLNYRVTPREEVLSSQMSKTDNIKHQRAEAESNRLRALNQTYRSVLSPEPETKKNVSRPISSDPLAIDVASGLISLTRAKILRINGKMQRLDPHGSGLLHPEDVVHILHLHETDLKEKTINELLLRHQSVGGKIYYKDFWQFLSDCHMRRDVLLRKKKTAELSVLQSTVNERMRSTGINQARNDANDSHESTAIKETLRNELKDSARKLRVPLDLRPLANSLRNCDRGKTGVLGVNETTSYLDVPMLQIFMVEQESIFKLMKSFVSELYDYNYPGERKSSKSEPSVKESDEGKDKVRVLSLHYLPLSNSTLDKVLQYLDHKNDGWVNYHELLELLDSANPLFLPELSNGSSKVVLTSDIVSNKSDRLKRRDTFVVPKNDESNHNRGLVKSQRSSRRKKWNEGDGNLGIMTPNDFEGRKSQISRKKWELNSPLTNLKGAKDLFNLTDKESLEITINSSGHIDSTGRSESKASMVEHLKSSIIEDTESISSTNELIETDKTINNRNGLDPLKPISSSDGHHELTCKRKRWSKSVFRPTLHIRALNISTSEREELFNESHDENRFENEASRMDLDEDPPETKPRTSSEDNRIEKPIKENAFIHEVLPVMDPSKPKVRPRVKKTPLLLFQSVSSDNDTEDITIMVNGKEHVLYPPDDLDVIPIYRKVPDKALQLKRIHGYSGSETYTNMCCLKSGELAYIAGIFVILWNSSSKIQRHYKGHNGKVSCLTVHPDGNLMASAQSNGIDEDSKAKVLVRVWNSTTLETCAVVGEGILNSIITGLAFSHKFNADKGFYLFVTDKSKDPLLTLWDWKNNRLVSQSKIPCGSILGLVCSPVTDELAVFGREHISRWKMNENQTLVVEKLRFMDKPIPKFVTAAVYNLYGHLIAGDSNGFIHIWSKGAKKSDRIIRNAHEGSVSSLALFGDILLSASQRDLRVHAWNDQFEPTGVDIPVRRAYIGCRFICVNDNTLFIGTSSNTVLQTNVGSDSLSLSNSRELLSLVSEGHGDSVVGICCHPFENRAVTAAADGSVNSYSSPEDVLNWKSIVQGNASGLTIHPSGNVVMVSCYDGSIHVLDGNTGQFITKVKATNSGIHALEFSPDTSLLAAGTHEGKVYIFKYDKKSHDLDSIGIGKGLSAPINALDWSMDGKYIRAQSSSADILSWQVPDMLVKSQFEMRNERWLSYNCSLDSLVAGLWTESKFSNPENAYSVAVSRSHGLTARGDLQGNVRVYNFPAPKGKPPFLSVQSSANSIKFLRITTDGQRLLAVASEEGIIYEWSIA